MEGASSVTKTVSHPHTTNIIRLFRYIKIGGMPTPAITLGGIVSIALPIVIILIMLYIVFKLGKFALKYVFGVIANSILGFAALFLLNYFFSVAIPFTLPIIITIAIFGLPAVGTLVILKLLGGLALS